MLADLRHQNGIIKTRLFLSICFFLIRPSVFINNKDLLKTRLIFNSYAHISCKNDWNNFLLLNTNGPLSKNRDNWLFMENLNKQVTNLFLLFHRLLLRMVAWQRPIIMQRGIRNKQVREEVRCRRTHLQIRQVNLTALFQSFNHLALWEKIMTYSLVEFFTFHSDSF